MKRKLFSIIFGCILVLGLSITVFAATTSFTATIPAHQGDTETSTVRKESDTGYFSITIEFIGTGTDKLNAWTEGDSTGTNYSSPYNQVGLESKNITYTLLPKIGENVVLNLDNPVDLVQVLTASGNWSPN